MSAQQGGKEIDQVLDSRADTPMISRKSQRKLKMHLKVTVCAAGKHRLLH